MADERYAQTCAGLTGAQIDVLDQFLVAWMIAALTSEGTFTAKSFQDACAAGREHVTRPMASAHVDGGS